MASVSTASPLAITLNVITCGLGAGILTMPWGMAGASILTYSALVIVINLINFWTLTIIIEASEKRQAFNLGALLRHLPGRWGSRSCTLCNVVVWSTALPTLLGYVIIAVDAITTAAPAGSALSCRWMASIFTGVTVLPLCLLNQKFLAFTSVLSIGVVLYVMALVVCAALSTMTSPTWDGLAGELCVAGVAGGAFTAACLLCYSVIMQFCVQPIYAELENRSPEKFRSILVVAFTVLTALYIGTGICGYIAFGPSVKSDVISVLPPGTATIVARGTMALCIVGTFPFQIMPVLVPFKARAVEDEIKEQLLPHSIAEQSLPHSSSRSSSMMPRASDGVFGAADVNLPVVSVAAVVVLVVTVASLYVSDLGPLVALNGALQVFAYTGVIPGVTGLFLLDRRGACWRVSCVLIILGSCCFAVGGFLFTDNHPEQLVAACAVVA